MGLGKTLQEYYVGQLVIRVPSVLYECHCRTSQHEPLLWGATLFVFVFSQFHSLSNHLTTPRDMMCLHPPVA
ncbi:unnamed protein product [Cuscuta europaea]|uniref:Uncharacterized protein n=1 Tax=Cuscuta europaea TaxID=41803 RepID=A0A9P0Z4L7_CUSEU|nr:unnamed protein product [Cuscuta europaea]